MIHDCDYTDLIVCPHCGHKHSWEDAPSDDEGDISCSGCGKSFHVVVNRSVSYTSTCGRDAADCDWKQIEGRSARSSRFECRRCGKRRYSGPLYGGKTIMLDDD